MKHRLLILGTLGEFVQLVKKAKERGYYTVVCDGYPDGPARQYADASYVIPVTDIDEVARLCRKENIDGIVTSFSDLLMECMVQIADRAGLPCYLRPEQLRWYRDKSACRELLSKLGLPTPGYVKVPATHKDESTLEAMTEGLRYPLISKPLDKYGSRGIFIIKDKSQLSERVSQTAEFTDLDEILIEEYNDRVERLKTTEKSLEDLSQEQTVLTSKINHKHQSINDLNQEITKNKNRQEILVDLVENKSNYHHGVKAIMELAHDNPDIIGVFGDLLENDSKYDLAVSVALGSALQFIVTKDNLQARLAIKFLKDNKAGRATFLPLADMEPRSLREEHAILCPALEGYLGVLSDFVSSSKNIDNVILNQLGNVILADDIDHAYEISKATYARYKVVTLDGNIVNVGGSLTGGTVNRQQSSILQKRELEKVKEKLDELEQKLVREKNELLKLENDAKELAHTLLQKQMSYAKLEVVVQGKKEELVVAKGEYESLSHQNVELDEFKSGKIDNQLVLQLNEAIKHRDELTEKIKSKRELRMSYVNENEQLESKLKDLRRLLKDIQGQIKEKAILSTKYEGSLNNYLSRLSNEYSMTYEYASENYHDEVDIEFARGEVATLRNEIVALGHVNIDAIEEYKEVSSRYENMNSQRLDLMQAQDKIVQAIDEMDQIMIEKFSTTFEKINKEFNNVFRELFGGGRAQIKYTDPDNILETGIDIDVQPPGKAVSNITLFSGGEKALIAISCLFAILKVRPVPMCILDEVEAALDMANVERFAKFLREFSKQTQFIVVTHREGTMEECDLLYGATMQQKGVTKLVSVKLEEAIDFSNENHKGGI